MEEEIINDKEISDYLDKYDISYWNILVPKLTKIGIRTLEKQVPNIYTIDEIDNYLKEIDPNPQEDEKDPYEGMWPENNEEERNINSPNEEFSNSLMKIQIKILMKIQIKILMKIQIKILMKIQIKILMKI